MLTNNTKKFNFNFRTFKLPICPCPLPVPVQTNTTSTVSPPLPPSPLPLYSLPSTLSVSHPSSSPPSTHFPTSPIPLALNRTSQRPRSDLPCPPCHNTSSNTLTGIFLCIPAKNGFYTVQKCQYIIAQSFSFLALKGDSITKKRSNLFDKFTNSNLLLNL